MQIVYNFQMLCQLELYYSVNALPFVVTQHVSVGLPSNVDNMQSTGNKNIIKPESNNKSHMLLIFNI